jgi:DNA mismatch endonuclease (patch repair protein)
MPKLEGNRIRDQKVKADLEALGWTVFDVWECQTTDEDLRQLADQLSALPPGGSSGNRKRQRK